jgi:hypothetical protein
MEKFFRVEAGSPVDVQYEEWVVESEKVRAVVDSFLEKHGIEANKFNYGKNGSSGEACYPGCEKDIWFGIYATPMDIIKLQSELKKPDSEGISYFRKNSKLRKELAELAIENKLRKLRKPSVTGHLGFYYCYYFKSWTRLFKYEGVLYGSVDSEKISDPSVDGITEMSGSEFYKIIEQIDSKKNGGTKNGEN